MLLAVWQARRATVDGDFLARNLNLDEASMLDQIREIAATAPPVEDGVEYLTGTARSGIIREGDLYSGVRVTMDALVSRSRVKLRLDISTGDPITPAPAAFDYPTLRASHPDVPVLGYPLQVVLAEKICTAVQLGSGNSRVRDYADVWTLTGTRDITAASALLALAATAAHREVQLGALEPALAGFAEVLQGTYASYRRRLGPDGDLLPDGFGIVVHDVITFADPLLTGTVTDAGTWSPAKRGWTS
jgi:hypothetical protein